MYSAASLFQNTEKTIVAKTPLLNEDFLQTLHDLYLLTLY